MHPTLLDFGELPWLGHLTLPSYFTMLMIGFILASYITWREARRVGVDPEYIIDLALYSLIFGVIGARLLHVFADGFFWDYVHLCTDPFKVEGVDLLGRSVSELTKLGQTGRLCTADAQCLASQESGRLVGAVCNETTGFCHPEQDCFRWAKFYAGGLAFYGGFIGAVGFGVIFLLKHRVGMRWAPKVSSLPKPPSVANVPVIGSLARFVKYGVKFRDGWLMIADLTAPVVAMALGFGRMGCLLAGCCFGKITDGPLGVHFPGGGQAYRLHRQEHLDLVMAQAQKLGEYVSLPVHPTQAYSSISNFAIFVFLWFVIRKRKRFHGEVFAWLLILYSVTRFIVEFWRADYRGEFMGLSTSQLIGIPVIALAIWILVAGLKGAKGVIDDGASPPLGRPLVETMHQARTIVWDTMTVVPAPEWTDELVTLVARVGPKKDAEAWARNRVLGVDDNDDGPEASD